MANPPKSTKNSSSDGKKADFSKVFYLYICSNDTPPHQVEICFILEIIIPKYPGSVDWKILVCLRTVKLREVHSNIFNFFFMYKN